MLSSIDISRKLGQPDNSSDLLQLDKLGKATEAYGTRGLSLSPPRENKTVNFVNSERRSSVKLCYCEIRTAHSNSA